MAVTIVPLDPEPPPPDEGAERAIERRRERRRRPARLYEGASDLFFLLLVLATLGFFALLLGLVQPVLYGVVRGARRPPGP